MLAVSLVARSGILALDSSPTLASGGPCPYVGTHNRNTIAFYPAMRARGIFGCLSQSSIWWYNHKNLLYMLHHLSKLSRLRQGHAP